MITAVKAQNVQVSVGKIGASPAVKGQQLLATVTAQSQLQTVDQFKAIILKIASDGSTVRLGNVARVELGLESYGSSCDLQRQAGGRLRRAAGERRQRHLDGARPSTPNSTASPARCRKASRSPIPTRRRRSSSKSIEKVVETLIEAIVLVFVVLLLFLQNLRATLIPMIAVPVVLLGTFGILAALGYSINMLTMFAMVLAIGLLVDDAIVVVENVERIMTEEGLPPREATEKSMSEITGALIGIALVLTAVFIPMAFFGGSVGVIYRQFSVTIVVGHAPVGPGRDHPDAGAVRDAPQAGRPDQPPALHVWLGWFNRGVVGATRGYVGAVGYVVARPVRDACRVRGYLRRRLSGLHQPPTLVRSGGRSGRAADPDLAADRRQRRPHAGRRRVWSRTISCNHEKDAVKSVFSTLGFSFSGSGENSAHGLRAPQGFRRAQGQDPFGAARWRAAPRPTSADPRCADLRSRTAGHPGAGSVERLRPCIWRTRATMAATR